MFLLLSFRVILYGKLVKYDQKKAQISLCIVYYIIIYVVKSNYNALCLFVFNIFTFTYHITCFFCKL